MSGDGRISVRDGIVMIPVIPDRITGDRDLSNNAYRVLCAVVVLCDVARFCFASNETIAAAAAGKSTRTVIRGLVELEARGLIRRHMDESTGQRDCIELTLGA